MWLAREYLNLTRQRFERSPVLKLTFRETRRLWGGVWVPRLEGSVVHCKDVSAAAMAVGVSLPTGARVACVHLNIFTPMFRQFMRGKSAAYSRDLFEARRLLQDQGYTHVALTGPMLETLKVDTRLVEVARVRNNPIYATNIAIGTWISFRLVWVAALLTGQDKRLRGRLSKSARATRRGFREYVIYEL